LVGKRLAVSDSFYLGVGGGLIINANGVGVGPYTAFGTELGSGKVKFNAEYKQALGISSAGLLSPYAIRMGVSYSW
jgi:hypothetical protein